MDFLVKELDIKFSFYDLERYFENVEHLYQYLKWTSDLKEDANGHQKHSIDGVYGWGIQSNLEDLNVPCPPYNVHKNGSDNYRDTPLVFGFADLIRAKIPYSRQLSIAAHPPGTKINLHTDSDTYLKIHMPIKTNDKAYFNFEDNQFVLQPGKMYLVNTNKLHGTSNEGDTYRTHLFFKIPADKIDEITRLEVL
jgi:hypothetical protein